LSPAAEPPQIEYFLMIEDLTKSTIIQFTKILQFLPIFRRKNGTFLKNQCQFLQKLAEV
jgi:hypothetical protein